MNNSLRSGILTFTAATLVVTVAACRHAPSPPPLTQADSLAIVQENVAFRAEKDSFFRLDPRSPFQRDTTVTYHGLRWFPIDPAFWGRSVLHLYAHPDTVNIMGTRGETRRHLRYGYFEFAIRAAGGPTTVRLNVYKFTPYDAERFLRYPENLSVWFTDSTTGIETYDVGRYVDVGDDVHDPDHLYTIDLNKAYNPYCAYSSMYSCAIPRKEDHLAIPVRAGEMKYHD